MIRLLFFVNPISLTTSTISATFLFSIDTGKNAFNVAYSVAFYHHRFDLDSDLFANVFIFAIFLLIVFHYLGKNQFFLHYLDCTRECNEKIKRAVTELRFFYSSVGMW